MTRSLLRTAIVTSLITAVAASALTVYAMPRLISPKPAEDATMQPALYQGSNSSQPNDEPRLSTRPRLHRAQPAYEQPVAAAAARDSYGEPVARHHRSTRNSALIVAGSAGTGAAIGALAGGGKGAGIGAIAGGVGGLIYDRLTANK